MAGSVLRLTWNYWYIHSITLVTLNCLQITVFEAEAALLWQQKASSNFPSAASLLNILEILYCLVLTLDGQNAFWEGTPLADSQYTGATTCIPTSHPWWSQQKKEFKEYLVPHRSCSWPCLCWVSLSIHQLRWRKRGEEVVENRTGALESRVIPGICRTGFTRTGSLSLNRLTCFLQRPLCWILGFYFFMGYSGNSGKWF